MADPDDDVTPTVQTSALQLDRPTFTVEVGPDDLAKADRDLRRIMDRTLVRLTNELGAQTRVRISVTYEVTHDVPGSLK